LSKLSDVTRDVFAFSMILSGRFCSHQTVFAAGFPGFAVAILCSSIAITMDTYSHLLPSMQKDAAGKMNEAFRFGEGSEKH